MDKLQEISPSTSYQTLISERPKTFKSRLSSLFHKKEPFEKILSKRLDKIIPLSLEIYINSNKYRFIKSFFTKYTLQGSYQNRCKEKSARNFIEKFEAAYDRKQKSMEKLLKMIKTNEDVNKALQMIDHRFESATDPDTQLAITKIKEVLNKTFKLAPSDEPSSSTKNRLYEISLLQPCRCF